MQEPVIFPQPQEMTMGEGAFVLDGETAVSYATTTAQPVADYLAQSLRVPTGLPLPLQLAAAPAAHNIYLTTEGADEDLGEEGYTLHADTTGVIIRANAANGLFYGVQTLRQLLPLAIEQEEWVPGERWEITAVSIRDFPRYPWRGLMLDVGRHLFPVPFIKKFIDTMALHKFNTLHWHLTEDQGWRLEIKKYPLLTEISAYRAASPIPSDRHTLDGKPYGGFYTQDEVREIVAYAQTRFITVVPEIEMPGHSIAVLAAYPELGCRGEGYAVRTFWGIEKDVYCAGNEAVYDFLQDVLTEVFDLFPSEFIHIGADECPKDRWRECPKCQAKIAAEGLADEYALQSYFVRQMEGFLQKNGRRLVGWDEILEGGLAPNATVMSWRGSKGGIEAAKAGHDVVMSPNTFCYLDYYQGEDTDNEPAAIGNYLPLQHVFLFDPTADIPADKQHHVLGGQGNIWTEYIQTGDHVEYMTYPRAVAIAEAVWTAVSDDRNFTDFLHRLRVHLARLEEMGVNYRPVDPELFFAP